MIRHVILQRVAIFLLTDCSIKIEGKKVRGFKCDDDNWCVPREYMCNGVPQCPDGSDEKSDLCTSKWTVMYTQ